MRNLLNRPLRRGQQQQQHQAPSAGQGHHGGLPPLHPQTKLPGRSQSRLGVVGGARSLFRVVCAVALVMFVAMLVIAAGRVTKGDGGGAGHSLPSGSSEGGPPKRKMGSVRIVTPFPPAVLHSVPQGAYEGKYRLARPLEGQVTSDEYFKPRSGYSSWWCGGPPGDKNVLGKRLDPRHYCAIRNMCIVNGRPTLFVESRREVEGMDSDEHTYYDLPHSAYARRFGITIRAGDGGRVLAEARREGRMNQGLTAIIGSSHGQTHITHIMESLGQLFYGLNIFGYYQDHGEKGVYLPRPLGPSLADAPAGTANLHPFNRSAFALKYAEVDRILLTGAGPAEQGSWVELFYRMLFTNKRISSASTAAKSKAPDAAADGVGGEGEGGEKDFPPRGTYEAFSPRIIDSVESHNGQCFDEAVLAGASYDPFHQVHMPSFHRQRDWFYGLDSAMGAVRYYYSGDGGNASDGDANEVSILQTFASAAVPEVVFSPAAEARLPGAVLPSSDAQRAIAEAVAEWRRAGGMADADKSPPPPPLRRPLRRVLLAHRSEKRTVRNAKELDQWMANTLPTLLPQYEWRIRSVNFAHLNNRERIEVAYWADILIGIHGADLTNLVGMRPTSAVVELYPLFYFESRFYEMSHSMQLHYFAWTCTRAACSSMNPTEHLSIFSSNDGGGRAAGRRWREGREGMGGGGGDQPEVYLEKGGSGRLRLSARAEAHISGSGDEGQIAKLAAHKAITRADGGWFKWPTDRYVGHECLGCDLIACCTSMQQTMYGPQRDSDVTFGDEELREMEALLQRAAAAVGQPFVPYTVRSFEERRLEAEALFAASSKNESTTM